MEDGSGAVVPMPTWGKALAMQVITRIRVNDKVFMEDFF
jgi:hypothetical protein